jgi:hypothetical protein
MARALVERDFRPAEDLALEGLERVRESQSFAPLGLG